MEYRPEPYGYINESERNVHVWCSLVISCSDPDFRGRATLGLIAGVLSVHIIEYTFGLI
jgi:hypothetical protein